MKTVCICGGGNLGHVIATTLASSQNYIVNILTNRPQSWRQELTVELPDGTRQKGKINMISNCPADVVSKADIVLLCLPGFLIRQTIGSILPYLQQGAALGSVVSSTGFFFEAMEKVPSSVCLFGFQRVPYIARTIEYGHSATILGYKQSLNVCIEHSENKVPLLHTLEDMFHTPVNLLSNHYEVSLTNSNPLLHPARLYSLWHDWKDGIVYDRVPLFYEEWDTKAAEIYIAMDYEFQQLLKVLPVKPCSIPTVLDYYESHDAESLAAKLRSITAFKGIKAPMKTVGKGYIPDFGSRYFTEDFPYGLNIIRTLAEEKNTDKTVIDMVFNWGKTFS
ncbi:MAG: NAD/NADP octopine/nopaline dehydrogenase family protein [Prevotella sp.]|nr:NAD/NADP octopine/nopaline dehydrogenase family protein [Prevotella sp.]MBQ9670435.1 NAD/NADP octopine/nopaline dehydrogenase family protein [Prevotella sp.]